MGRVNDMVRVNDRVRVRVRVMIRNIISFKPFPFSSLLHCTHSLCHPFSLRHDPSIRFRMRDHEG